MSRPLLVTDCDEVLLHMVVPFAEWAADVHDIHLDLGNPNFAEALRHRKTGAVVERDRMWSLVEGFFETEMHRQRAIEGAVAAITEIARVADIVVLTNIGEAVGPRRAVQLKAVGIDAPVVGNRGGKGAPLAAILAERAPSVAVFVDDLGTHHHSVSRHAPGVWRLHMVGEPLLSRHVEPAEMAHARIDDWPAATRWILDRFAEGPAGLDPTPSAMLNGTV